MTEVVPEMMPGAMVHRQTRGQARRVKARRAVERGDLVKDA